MQLIVRVAPYRSQAAFAQHWFPDVEPRMLYVQPKDKTKLIKYVLHAKHKKPTVAMDRPDYMADEEHWKVLLEQSKVFVV